MGRGAGEDLSPSFSPFSLSLSPSTPLSLSPSLSLSLSLSPSLPLSPSLSLSVSHTRNYLGWLLSAVPDRV